MLNKLKNGFLTGNQLKFIALITMTLDHIGAYLLPQYLILRIIGRIAMPVFAFKIAEGCRYTKNRKKYLSLLISMSVLFQVVYLIFMHSLEMCIFVTFSLSVILIYLLDNALDKKDDISIAAFAAGLAAVYFITRYFSVDYGFFGVLIPVLIYPVSTKRMKLVMTALGLVLLSYAYRGVQWYCFMALPLLALYNGKRGKYNMKYLFYIYYPVHLVIIYFIGFFV